MKQSTPHETAVNTTPLSTRDRGQHDTAIEVPKAAFTEARKAWAETVSRR